MKKTTIILSILFFQSSFTTAWSESNISTVELIPDFLSVKTAENLCELNYTHNNFTQESMPCVADRNDGEIRVYSDPNQITELTDINPITQKVQTILSLQPKQALATIHPDEVIIDDILLTHLENNTRSCMPIDACQKAHLAPYDILILQDDYAYIVRDNFGKVQLKRQPFTIQYANQIYSNDDTTPAFYAAFSNRDVLSLDYHGNLANIADDAFVSVYSLAMPTESYQAFIPYSKDFLGEPFEKDNHNGFNYLFYSDDALYRVQKLGMRNDKVEFAWEVLGFYVRDMSDQSIIESPFSGYIYDHLYFLSMNTDTPQSLTNPQAIKYIDIEFIQD